MNENIDFRRRKESGLKRGVRMRAFAIVLALAGATSVLASQDRSEILALMHDGRFDAARELLRYRANASPPEIAFFVAFTTYWQLIFDDANPALKATLETELTASMEAAERAMDGENPGDAALWGGSSHLLLAELRASQRRPLAAAFEAKRARKLLESDTLSAPAALDALFGLGTYNYVADTVPSYVKGLRALLFLPKGNRSKGLEQLENAAVGSRSFAVEARILLMTIYSNKHERLYGRSLDERDLLLRSSPDAIAAAYASARLDLALGRFEAALASLARAEARERQLGDVDPVVLRSMELLRAQAELAMLRPDLAHATAERALATGLGLGPSIRDDLVEVNQAAESEAAGIDWSPVGEARSPDQDAAAFALLATAHPEHPIFALLAGDARLRGGHAEEALTWFARVDLASLPPDLQASCRFRQACANDLLGRRSQAIELYGRVAAISGFVAKDGAFFHQVSPYSGAP